MSKKFALMLLCLFLFGAFYNLWASRPVNILYANSNEGITVTLAVDHMPWTDKAKIDWYLARRDDFKKKYPYSGNIWQSFYFTDIGNGFTNYKKSPHEDLLCFSTIKNEDNCVVKNYFLIVYEYTDGTPRFFPDSDMEYQLTRDKKIVPVFLSESVAR